MTKSIDDMTDEERGRLFPIRLSDPHDEWKHVFLRERAVIRGVLGADALAIEHIGSTAITGIMAKPTIDILVTVGPDTDIEGVEQRMGNAGYACSRVPDNPPPHRMFMKGYSPEGYVGQAVHVHLRYPGYCDEIRFRDYLNTHPDTAKEYERLKIDLAEKHRYNREDYTRGKTDFVNRINRIARDDTPAILS